MANDRLSPHGHQYEPAVRFSRQVACGSRRYHRSNFDDEDGFDETGDDYEMGEIYDYSLAANHWSDLHGERVRLGEINLDQ